MTDVGDLVAWLTQIWDEDERAARAVAPLEDVPTMGGPMSQSFGHVRHSYAGEDCYPRTLSDPAAAKHFARYEPAAMVTRIAAERAIFRAHACTDCNHGFVPCLTQQMFALAYSDRPGYREEWGT